MYKRKSSQSLEHGTVLYVYRRDLVSHHAPSQTVHPENLNRFCLPEQLHQSIYPNIPTNQHCPDFHRLVQPISLRKEDGDEVVLRCMMKISGRDGDIGGRDLVM